MGFSLLCASLSMDYALPIAITPITKHSPANLVQSKPGLLSHLLDHFIPHARNNYHPHILSHRMTALLSGLLVAVKLFTIAAVTFGPVIPAFSSAITPVNIISLTNESRQSQGLSELTENSLLDTAAQSKADDMLTKGYFSHNTPDGKTPWDFITTAGYNYITAGENLAVNFSEAENVEVAWMNSPGHRANILNKNYQEIGIGISQGQYQGHSAIFVVQMFGTLAHEKIALNDVPTKVQTESVPSPTHTPTTAAQVQSAGKTITAQAPQTVASQPMALLTPHVEVKGTTITISAQSVGPVVKVVALYGSEGVLLQPKEGDKWEGVLDMGTLTSQNASVVIKAYNMAGATESRQVAEFAGSTPVNYSLAPQVKSAHISVAGLSIDPKMLTQNFYLVFIVSMLMSLILAIAIKRHIQHVSLVMNGSLVIMLAVFLWIR